MRQLARQTWFAGSLDDVTILPSSRLVAGETERHDCQHQNHEERDDGEDERPSHLTVPDVVVPDVAAADTTHVHVVPAGREYHAAKEYQNACQVPTTHKHTQAHVCRAVFDGGSGGFDSLQEVADPPRKFCRTSLGGRL